MTSDFEGNTIIILRDLFFTVISHVQFIPGYAYSQGLSEDLIGGLLGAAASSGIIATFLYPRIRRAIGLESTGLYALAAEVACLILCVASVFCPGSPFDPGYYTRARPKDVVIHQPNSDFINTTRNFHASIDQLSYHNTSMYNKSAATFPLTTSTQTTSLSYVSITLLMTGIISARVGM